MSSPKTERNKLLVKLRKQYEKERDAYKAGKGKKPKKEWTWAALADEFKFKSRNAAREIYAHSKDKF